jgi:hypothetical protein
MLDFATWLVFAATGRILIYVWQLFPFPTFAKVPKWLNKLHECDLCSGVWIYGVLALALQVDIFSYYFGVTPNIVGELSTAVVTSYLVHVFIIGLKEKYAQPIVI